MLNNRRITNTVFIVSLVALFYANACFACSCAYQPIQERFDNAKYAFSAKIIATDIQRDPDSKSWSSMDKVKITIGPRSEYKKDSSHLEFLYTYAGGSSCGVSVTIGETYTFLLGEKGFVHLCGSIVSSHESTDFHNILVKMELIDTP